MERELQTYMHICSMLWNVLSLISLFVHAGLFPVVFCSLFSILLIVDHWGLQGYSTSPVNLLSCQCLVSSVILCFFWGGGGDAMKN